MVKNFSILLVCWVLFAFQSCCFSTKNTSLGNKIYISEYSFKELSIMYCLDRCCNSGTTIIPETVVAYNFNEKWIIAKSDSEYYNPKNNFAYWVFNKNNSSTKDLNESIKANLYGPLDSALFYKLLFEKGIKLKLINYLHDK
jgi:hypothetical protein